MFSQDFKEFVELLIQNKVEYLIVGGYAVSIHGHPRYTGDLDVWIKLSEINAQRILISINEFGFSSFNLAISDFLKEGNVVQLGYPPQRIDVLNQIDGVEFESCFSNRKEINISGVSVNFIGLEDLLKNKKASGRLRDMDDIDNLQ